MKQCVRMTVDVFVARYQDAKLPQNGALTLSRLHRITWTNKTKHPFNGPLSVTTRVRWYQKGKTNRDITEARGSEWQWHQLGHMQVCTSLQTDNHSVFYRPDALPAAKPTASKHWRHQTSYIQWQEITNYFADPLSIPCEYTTAQGSCASCTTSASAMPYADNMPAYLVTSNNRILQRISVLSHPSVILITLKIPIRWHVQLCTLDTRLHMWASGRKQVAGTCHVGGVA